MDFLVGEGMQRELLFIAPAPWMVQAEYAIKTEDRKEYSFGGPYVSFITPQREFLAEFDLNCSDHGNKKSPFHSIFPPGNSLAVSYSVSPTKMSIH